MQQHDSFGSGADQRVESPMGVDRSAAWRPGTAFAMEYPGQVRAGGRGAVGVLAGPWLGEHHPVGVWCVSTHESLQLAAAVHDQAIRDAAAAGTPITEIAAALGV